MVRKFKKIIITVLLFALIFTNSILYANDGWNNGTGVKEILYETSSADQGAYLKVALKEDGTLWRLQEVGSDYKIIDIKTPIKLLDNVEKAGNSYAIQKDGSLWVWGENGRGVMPGAEIPVKIFEDVKDARMSYNNKYVLQNNGDFWTWGDNYSGQLGDGSRKDSDIPIKIATDVKYGNFGYIIKNDNSLWTWGGNSAGIIGNGTKEDVLSPVKVMENVKYAFNNGRDIYNQPEGYSSGYYTHGTTAMFAVKEDNTLWSWGSNSEEMYDDQSGYGEHISGILGNGTTYDSYKPFKIMENVKYANCGSFCGYAIKEDDTLWIWGANVTGNLGKDIGKRILKPTKMMEDVKYANIYYYSGYAIKNDNSLWGWGANDSHGYLGNGERDKKVLTPIHMMDNVKEVGPMYVIQLNGDAWEIDGGGASDTNKFKKISMYDLMYNNAAYLHTKMAK